MVPGQWHFKLTRPGRKTATAPGPLPGGHPSESCKRPGALNKNGPVQIRRWRRSSGPELQERWWICLVPAPHCQIRPRQGPAVLRRTRRARGRFCYHAVTGSWGAIAHRRPTPTCTRCGEAQMRLKAVCGSTWSHRPQRPRRNYGARRPCTYMRYAAHAEPPPIDGQAATTARDGLDLQRGMRLNKGATAHQRPSRATTARATAMKQKAARRLIKELKASRPTHRRKCAGAARGDAPMQRAVQLFNVQRARSLHAVKRLKWSRLAGTRIAVAAGRWKGNASQWPCWTNGDGEELNVKWGFLKPQMQPWRADTPLCVSCVRFKLEPHQKLRVGVAARAQSSGIEYTSR